MERIKRNSRRGQRGAGVVEYVFATGVTVAAVVVPFGSENKNAIQRLTDAIRGQQEAYNYSARLPALPNVEGNGSFFPLPDGPVNPVDSTGGSAGKTGSLDVFGGGGDSGGGLLGGASEDDSNRDLSVFDNPYGSMSTPSDTLDPMGLRAQTVAAEGVRTALWCIARAGAFYVGYSELPDIMKQQTDMAEESRVIGVEGCAEQREFQKILTKNKQHVIDGEFNVCQERVEMEYRDRVLKIVKEDGRRYLNLDRNVDELISECIGPSPDDLDISKKSKHRK